MPTNDDDTDYEKRREERDARERKRHDLLCALLGQALANRGDQIQWALRECKPYTIRELASEILSPDEIVEAVYEQAEKEIAAQVKKRVDEARAKLRVTVAEQKPKGEKPGPTKKPAASAKPATPASKPLSSDQAMFLDQVLACFDAEPKAFGHALAKVNATRGALAHAIERLLADGRLKRDGKGRGAKYTRADAPAPAPKQPALFDGEDDESEDDET